MTPFGSRSRSRSGWRQKEEHGKRLEFSHASSFSSPSKGQRGTGTGATTVIAGDGAAATAEGVCNACRRVGAALTTKGGASIRRKQMLGLLRTGQDLDACKSTGIVDKQQTAAHDHDHDHSQMLGHRNA